MSTAPFDPIAEEALWTPSVPKPTSAPKHATTFKERADILLAFGLPLIPLRPNGKDPCTTHAALDASLNPKKIAQWAKQFPISNVGAVAQHDGFWFLDDDAGTLAAAFKKATGRDMPFTLRVKTSRGFHYYFRHDEASRLIRYGNGLNGTFDVPGVFKGEARCNNQYVVAPGSVHPSGAVYTIEDDAPIVAAPVALLEWLQQMYAESEKIKQEELAKLGIAPKSSGGGTGDPGFQSLFDIVGYRPLLRRMNAADVDVKSLEPGQVVPCPMPQHEHDDFTPCFGPLAKVPEMLHCCGKCKWSGDMVAACYYLDGGAAKYKNMYACARAICKEEGLKFETFFPPKPDPVQPAHEPDYEKAKPAESEPADAFVLTSGTADQIAPKKIVWLWFNRFAQKLNMIVGNPDNGKGLITHYVTACVTTGREWFDSPNTNPPSDVLILTGEEDWDDTVVPRLMAAGADLSKVHWLKMSVTKNGTRRERELQLDRDIERLEGFLGAHPAIRLVIIDPISSYMGRTSMIDEQKVRGEVLTPLKDLSSRRAIAIIGVMHLNKKVELDAIHRIGGAVAFVGVARMVWLCAPKTNEDGTDSDDMLMVKVKGNIVHRKLTGLGYHLTARSVSIEDEEVMIPYVKWIGCVDATANQVTGKKTHPAHRGAVALPAAEQWLRDYLRAGAKPQKEIEDQGVNGHDFSKGTLLRAKQALGLRSFQQERQWFWELSTVEGEPV